MKTLQQLIDELCPNGVEFKKLGELTDLHTGNQFNKRDMLVVGPYPVVNGGIRPSGFADVYNEEANTITVSQGGASAGFVNWMETRFFAGAHCFVLKPISNLINNRYLYHFIKNQECNLLGLQHGAGIPALNRSHINDLEIPVPPLAVQEKIVEILDNFTALTAELQAELQARQQQYEYYRNRLLSFGGLDNIHSIDADGVDRAAHGSADERNRGRYKWLKMKDICCMKFDRISYSDLTISNYTSVENLLKDRGGRCDCDTTPSTGSFVATKPNDILIGNIRPYLRKIWFSNCKGGTNGDVIVARLTSDGESIVIPKYLFYQLSSERFFNYVNAHVKAGKMPRGDKSAIFNFEFPIPPLAEQQLIVDILDRFEALTSDLQNGLPAEIDARQQQYEYYRNKLLTFKRLGA